MDMDILAFSLWWKNWSIISVQHDSVEKEVMLIGTKERREEKKNERKSKEEKRRNDNYICFRKDEYVYI